MVSITDRFKDSSLRLFSFILRRGSESLFTNAVEIRGKFSDNNSHEPKPDAWFGLSLYNDSQLSRLKGLEIRDKDIEYFKPKKLEDMNTTRREKLIFRPVKSREHAAFPWMVVEYKKEKGDEDKCVRQAANGSYTSLMLCERLAAPAGVAGSPIVAFTSVGSKVKIFITYKSEDGAPKDEIYVRPYDFL